MIPDNKLSILIVVDRYAPEARSAAHLYEDLARGLARCGHKVSVVTKKPTENLPNGSKIPGIEVKDDVRVLRMRSYLREPRSTLLKGLDHVLFALRVWVRLQFLESPDVVLVYTPPLLLALACALAHHPLVVNLHDIYPRTAVELGRLSSPMLIFVAEHIENFVYRRARRFVVPAPDTMVYLKGEKGIPAGRVCLCYNWVNWKAPPSRDVDAFREAHALGGLFIVTYAGLVGVAQDLSAVIDAARKATGDENLLFLIIGDGSELARWRREAEGLANIRFLPTLSREGYLESLRASDACLLALSADLKSPAIPGKLSNIMAEAKPVLAVVPKGSAAACAVLESGCGLVTPPGDGVALLDAVRLLRVDPELRARLGGAGRHFAEEHFSLDDAVGVFEAALASALEN